jgi:hypothetical protein
MAEAEYEEEEEEEELTPEQEQLLPGPVQQYLQEIGTTRLLTAAQEVELSIEIENGRLLARPSANSPRTAKCSPTKP